MKTTFIWTCMVFLMLSCLSFPTYAASTPVKSAKMTEQQANLYKNTIDQALAVYIKKQSSQTYLSSLQILKTKIAIMQSRSMSTISIFVLQYLMTRVDEYIKEYGTPSTPVTGNSSTGTVTQTGTTTSLPSISIADYKRGPHVLLAGNRSIPISKFVVTAQLEDVLIQTIQLSANIGNLDQVLSSVQLYDTNGVLIAEGIPQGGTVVFGDLSHKITQGSHALYLAVTPHPIGFQHAGLQKSVFTLNFNITKARGLTSQQNVEVGSDVFTTEEITVSPIKITSLNLVSSFGGRNVDQALFNNSENVLGIVQITAKNSPNTKSTNGAGLETVLRQLKVRVQDNTQAHSVAATLRLVRINGQDSDGIMGTSVGDIVTFDLTALSSADNVIANNQSVGFALLGTPSLNTTSRESVRIDITNIDNGALIYSSDDPSAQEFTKIAIGTQEINGPVVIEP